MTTIQNMAEILSQKFSYELDNPHTLSAMDKLDKPQIIIHVQKGLNYTAHDAKWIPCSARFVVLGSHAKGTGAMQVFEVSRGSVNLVKDVSKLFRIVQRKYCFKMWCDYQMQTTWGQLY